MARTKKSRGAAAFKMRSGNSPNKFLGAMTGMMGGGISGILGGRGNRNMGAGAGPLGPGGGQMGLGMMNQRLQQKFGGGGMGGNTGAQGGPPMLKKEPPYKKRIGCAKRSPMLAADTGLIKAYSDAMRGHGQIVKTIKGKTKSIANIGASLGEIFSKKSKRGSTRNKSI